MNGEFLSAEDVIAMNTCDAANAMLRPDLGSLEVGKRADIVVRSRDVPEGWPAIDPIQNLALVQRTCSVSTVIVQGNVVVQDGALRSLDAAEIYERSRASALRVAQRANLST
jgi:5-methylthioadenosine/S-adenosylhomocysteine deaminase